MLNMHYNHHIEVVLHLVASTDVLCPGHTFTDHLAGSTTDKISRTTPEMPFSVDRYECPTVWLRVLTYLPRIRLKMSLLVT